MGGTSGRPQSGSYQSQGQQQPFQAGGAGGDKRSICWQFNKKDCSREASYKFRHACSFCGVPGHPEVKCFKKQGKSRDLFNKAR